MGLLLVTLRERSSLLKTMTNDKEDRLHMNHSNGSCIPRICVQSKQARMGGRNTSVYRARHEYSTRPCRNPSMAFQCSAIARRIAQCHH